VQVPGYLTIGDTEAAQKAISAVVVATQNAKAEVIRGEAEAEVEALVVSKRAEAAEKFGKDGVDISLHQALERIAETNKGGSIIVNLGTGEDAFSRAAFAELQKLNEKGGVK
jgi:Ribonuclease G/E